MPYLKAIINMDTLCKVIIPSSLQEISLESLCSSILNQSVNFHTTFKASLKTEIINICSCTNLGQTNQIIINDSGSIIYNHLYEYISVHKLTISKCWHEHSFNKFKFNANIFHVLSCDLKILNLHIALFVEKQVIIMLHCILNIYKRIINQNYLVYLDT